MRHAKQVVASSPLATNAADAVLMPKATRSGAFRARKLGAAGKVVLAAIVHQETVLFDSGEDEQFQSSSQHDQREETTTRSSGKNSKSLAKETPKGSKKITHDDKGEPSLTSKFSRLFSSKKKQQHLIDSTQANGHHHQSSCPSSTTTTLRKHHQQYQLDAQSVADADDDLQYQQQQQHRRTQTMSNGGISNNKNDSEQVIEFKFDLIVDQAAHLANCGNEAADARLMKDKLNDNVNELVESFVLDSNDVCLMSTGRHQETTNLNTRYHSEPVKNGNIEPAPPQQQYEFDYLSELAAHTLASSFGLLNSKECSSSNKVHHSSHSNADDGDDDDESAAIGNKFTATTTTPNGNQRHSIEVSATLFLSEPLEDACESAAPSAGHLPPTHSGNKFSIFDLLDEREEKEENTSDQQQRPMANCDVDDLATNCDHHEKQRQQATTAKNSPATTSIDCLSVDEALATIEKVKNKVKRLLLLLPDDKGRGQKRGSAESKRQQPLSNGGLDVAYNEYCNYNSSMRSSRERKPSLTSSLLLISLKLKQRINGGLFSNRMCLIDFDPKFIELHSIFESIFNGQALAYLKRHKIHLRTLESKLTAAAATGDRNNAVAACGATDAAAKATANNANDSSLARTNELELKQHHQVASYTNKLIQAEWLLYKQLSSALIRTLIIVHVHKLSVLPLPSISGSDLILKSSTKTTTATTNFSSNLNCEQVAEDDNDREGLIALTNKRNYIECQQRKLMGDNLILLEFARSIQRASAIRLKRRKRHLKSHLASSNASVASNISATTPAAPNCASNNNGDPFSSWSRFKYLSANRRANCTGDDKRYLDCGANDYERYDHDYDVELIEPHQFSREYSIETSLTRHRHRHHHHYHHYGEPKHHYLQRQHYPTIDNGRRMVSSSTRHLPAATAAAHSNHTRRDGHAVQRNHHQPAAGGLLQASDCQTESSSLSTSSGSQPTTKKIRSARSSRADSHRFATLQDNGSSTLNSNFSDSDSITSANLNSCSSSSYNHNSSSRFPSTSQHHYSRASSRPRRDVELKWLAKRSRLVKQQGQFATDQLVRDQQHGDQLELNFTSPPVRLFPSSCESPTTPPATHRRSSSVSRVMSPRESSLVGSVIQIDCHRPSAYPVRSKQQRVVMSDCHLSQDEEGAVSSSSFLCSSSSLSSQQHTLTRIAHNLQSQSQAQATSDNEMESRTNGCLEDNVSDICSVVAEPPKQLKLEEFLNQLSSIIAPIASASTASRRANSDYPNQQQPTKTKDSSSPVGGKVNSNSVAVVDEDEEDCKSHSSILEHLASLAMESNSRLNNRQQQQHQPNSLDCQSYYIGRQLSLEVGDNEHNVECDNMALRGQQLAVKNPTGHLQKMLNSTTRRSTSSRVLLADPSASVEDKLKALTISCQQQASPSSPSASSGAFTSSNDSSCSSSSSVVAEHHGRRAVATIGRSPLSNSNSLKSRQQGLYASVIRSHQNVKT